jgi:hypothetical protein
VKIFVEVSEEMFGIILPTTEAKQSGQLKNKFPEPLIQL